MEVEGVAGGGKKGLHVADDRARGWFRDRLPDRLRGFKGLGTVVDRSAAASCLVSGLGLVVLPKCPLCLSGYATLFATLGLSASSLGSWRGVLGAVMLSAAALLLIRLVTEWRKPVG